jgi:intersectin
LILKTNYFRALSDIDNDGKLSLEEFIVSGHLCDMAAKGEPLPAVLPPNLMPPRYRKNAASDSVSTPGSITGDMGSPSTFEDKRKENFNKGQAELERRRQSLVDQQKKEEDERKKKEKAEAEEREKQK